MTYLDILIAAICAVGLVTLLCVVVNDLIKELLDSRFRDVAWRDYASALILVPALIYCVIRLLGRALGSL